MTIERNPMRSEKDDFALNVAPQVDALTEAVPVRREGFVVGWIVRPRYE